MPTRRRRSSLGRRGSRRKLVWATHEFAGVTLPMGGDTAAQSFDLLEDLARAGTSTLGATIMRTHMRLQVQSTAGGGLANFPRLRYGLSVDQRRNVSTGGAPALDISSANSPAGLTNDAMAQYLGVDWALLDTYIPMTMVSGKWTTSGTSNFYEGWFVDLKSRRKVQEVDQTWALAFYVEVSGTDPAFQVSGFTRTLLALP